MDCNAAPSLEELRIAEADLRRGFVFASDIYLLEELHGEM